MSEPSPRRLTHDLFEGLLDSLTAAGFPTRESLYPGLTDEQMDEITAPLGLVLPDEARVWWSAQNGGGSGALLGAYRGFAPLEDMVASAHQARQLQAMCEDDGVFMWTADLLPLVHSEVIFACDCAVPAGVLSPISVLIPKEAEDIRMNVLPSFGELVATWTRAIDEGLYEYLPDRGYAVSHVTAGKQDMWGYGLP